MNGPGLVCAGCNQPTTLFKPVCDSCLRMAGQQPGTATLCKHDWVGDDHCAYCRTEELEGALGEIIEACESRVPTRILSRIKAIAIAHLPRESASQSDRGTEHG